MFRKPKEIKNPQSFYLYICKLLLSQQLCKWMLLVTWREELSWRGCGVDVPMEELCLTHRHGRDWQSCWQGPPLPSAGGKKGILCPSLLSNKSWEFVFALAKYVPTTMQGDFSSA